MDKKILSYSMAQKLKELRMSKGFSFPSLISTLNERYGLIVSDGSLKNYEVSRDYHSRSDKTPNMKMKVETLLCLADLYGVSTDYLLGRADLKSFDTDQITACKYTGLSESAAEDLSEYKDSPLVNGLNLLLSTSIFLTLCGSIDQLTNDVILADEYEKSEPYKGENIQVFGDARTEINITGYDLCEFRYQNIIKGFSDLVDSLTGMDQLRKYTQAKRYNGGEEFIASYRAANEMPEK